MPPDGGVAEPKVSGFTIVRNATLLDFPLEASIRSLLPHVDEFVVNVGASDDDTLDRVRLLNDSRVRIVESTWDRALGTGMLAHETQRAMSECRHPWGIYIQADEVFAGDGGARVRAAIARNDPRPNVEGVLVDYRHFYGGFDTIASNRAWYRREVRAVRLNHDIHSYRDAQGFRVGSSDRRVRAVRSGAIMHHYGWARPTWALANKRSEDRSLDPVTRQRLDGRPLLPWIPGITPFQGEHPSLAAEWIDARRDNAKLIGARSAERGQWKLRLLSALERATGWRPFEFRNYDEVSG